MGTKNSKGEHVIRNTRELQNIISQLEDLELLFESSPRLKGKQKKNITNEIELLRRRIKTCNPEITKTLINYRKIARTKNSAHLKTRPKKPPERRPRL